jgi:hypothetical protein
MLKDTILSYINDDGNLVYINDLVSAFDNWQSALGIFLGASNYKFIDISMSNEMDSATFTSGTTQLIFKTSSSLPSLATGTIIIATCNKTFTVTEQNRATVYVWLSDVEQRSSETGQEYTAIKRALFSNTQPTGISEVAKTYNVSESDILSNRRTAALALARQVAMYIARETTNLSYKAIGESFGKDHTTVLHNVRCIENFLRDKPYQKELVDDIIKNLKSDNTAY